MKSNPPAISNTYQQPSSELQQQNSSSISSSDDDSEYRQKQAFIVPQIDPNNIEPEELEAYQYLISVRNQAEDIKAKNKQAKKLSKNRNEKLEESSIVLEEKKSNIIKQKGQQPSWFVSWKQEVISNWKCLVQNFIYLHKQTDSSKCFRPGPQSIILSPKTSAASLLSQKPMIQSISTLPLDIIEQFMTSLSEQEFTKKGKYYYLWIYSLLAAHRALASYRIFSALADVNACIDSSTENNHDGNAECLVVCCLMEEQFSQTGLRNKYSSMIEGINAIN